VRSLLAMVLVLGACSHDRDLYIDEFPHGATKQSPLVVALHGFGGRPENIAPLFDDFPDAAEIAVPRGFYAEGDGWAWFHFEPNITHAEVARRIADADGKLWAELATVAHGRRIIVVGFSQGAMMAYSLAVRHPAEVSAAFPISGWLPSEAWPHGQTALIVAWHGTDDDVVPIELDRETVAGFHAAGVDVELREQRGVKHRWEAMQADVIAHVRAALASK
jgi:phospholipase/carboxylesterase